MLRLLLTSASLLSAAFLAAAGNGGLTTLVGLELAGQDINTLRIGQAQAAFPLGLALGTLGGRRLIEGFGHIRAYSAFTAIYVCAVLLHIQTIEVNLWILLRLAEGMAFSGILIILESWLNNRADTRWRGTLFSLYMVVSYLGVIAGQLILRLPGCSLFPLIALLPLLSLLPISLCRIRQPEFTIPEKVAFSVLVKKAPYAFGGSFASGLVVGGFYALGPVFARNTGLSLNEITVFMTATIVGSVCFQWPAGRLSDVLGRRRVLIGAYLLTAVFALLVPFAIDLPHPTLPVLLFFFGGAAFSLYPVNVAHANDWISRGEILAASGAIVLTFSAGNALSPILVAWLMEKPGGDNNLFFFFAFTSFVMALFGVVRLSLRRRRRHAPDFFDTPVLSLPAPTGLASAASHAITTSRLEDALPEDP